MYWKMTMKLRTIMEHTVRLERWNRLDSAIDMKNIARLLNLTLSDVPDPGCGH